MSCGRVGRQETGNRPLAFLIIQHTDVPEVAHSAPCLSVTVLIMNTGKSICWNFLFNSCHTSEKRKKSESLFKD